LRFNPEVFWPNVNTIQGASKAANAAATAALYVAAVTGTVAIIATFYGPVMGVTSSSILDARLAAIVGWRVRALSRAWAVIGLVYWMFILIVRLVTNPDGASTYGFIGALVLLAFINGVRGTFAFERLRRQQELAHQA
jgi:hypothetical protein